MNLKKLFLAGCVALCVMSLASYTGRAATTSDQPGVSESSAPAYAADLKKVSGTVIDANGEPVIGAVVFVQNDNKYATTTNEKGQFSFSVPAGSTVVVSNLGFKDQEIYVSKDVANAELTLEEDVNMLDELVFVGYGVQKRSDITGSVASVEAEQLKKIPTTNVAEMLRGSVAGVQVNLSSAAPGGSSSVLIRGRRSLSGDNEPIYVVDGVYMRNINDLEANDIVSMEVLKDAAAQSIYGARAANGVILITTKQGKQNTKATVSYDGYVAVQSLRKNFEYMDPEFYIQYRKDAYTNYFGNYNEDECFQATLGQALREGAYIDWEKEGFQTAIQQKHSVSLQGGGKNNSYAASVGYYGQDGMVPSSWFNRVNGSFNYTQKVTDWFTYGTRLQISRGTKRTAESGFYNIIMRGPLGYLYEDDGVTPTKYIAQQAQYYSDSNPLWNNPEYSAIQVMDRFNGTVFADVTFCPGFTYRLNANYSTRITDTHNYYTSKHTSYNTKGGRAYQAIDRTTDFVVENILNYTKDFAKKHHFDATLMQSIQGSRSGGLDMTAENFQNDDFGADAINTALKYETPSFTKSQRNIASFLGRVRYSYDSKYLFSAALRIDGSSVFGAKNKWGFFPSAAFAWRIDKEPWMESSSDWLNNLKLRLSYGEVGNQGVSPYQTLGSVSTSYIEYDKTAVGFLPGNSLYNPDLKWETTASANIGIDFGFFKDRINGSIEVYNSDTRDLLVTRTLPSATGYTEQPTNLGKVNNKGIEVTLNTTPVSTKDFQWDFNVTWSMNRNKIVSITGEIDEETGKELDDVTKGWFIGQPMNVYYAYQMLGVFTTEDATNGVIANSNTPDREPGQIHVADNEPDGKYDTKDKILYYKDPKWIAGINTAIMWKGFDLSATIDGQYGGVIKNSLLYDTDKGANYNGQHGGIKIDYWREDNQIQTMYKPLMTSTMQPDYDLIAFQNASFIRLRNVTLGYTLPKSVLNKIKLSNIRVYFSGTNLWWLTEVLGYGPGSDSAAYPQSRMFQFGLNVSF